MEEIEITGKLGYREAEITGISTDSRFLEKGTLFVAVKGCSLDGHDYIDKAVEAGASAVVAERPVQVPVPVLLVEDTSLAVAFLARKLYNNPASGMFLAGITGTNGKTSTAFLLRSILEVFMGRAGIIGTVGFGSSDSITATDHTSPAAPELFRILAGFASDGCKSAVMEVSSHGAVQGRINGLEFEVGVFTNITRDHLDYHGTLEDYIAAKEILASNLISAGREKSGGTLVYNIDDNQVNGIGKRFTGRKISFGFQKNAMVRAESLLADLEGTRFTLVTDQGSIGIDLKLLGKFSAYNALAAAGAALAAGANLDHIKTGLEKVEKVPGRFQVIRSENGVIVVVDYAHTPDALENMLGFCRELGAKRLVTVFGCGGDRDRGKRSMMGKIAVDLSDKVYITSDNPRTEDPDAIIDDILAGIIHSDTDVSVIADRAEAMREAVTSSVKGDLVVIAGKGHEDYQVLKTGKIHFSDIEEVEKAFRRMEAGYQD